MKEKKIKKNKKPGPIRTGAVVPFLSIVLAVIAFNFLLLDSTIQKSIEFLGGKITGAEVNVSEVTTSFKDLKITVKKVEFTDPEAPRFNKLEIGELDFQLLWDALLRGKLVVTLANIQDIMINTKRDTTGEVFPVVVDTETGNSKATQELLEKTEKEFEGNVFGDIAGILGGGSTGDVSKNIQGTLKSKKKFDEIKTQLKNKEKQLNTDLKNLPTTAQIQAMQKRLKNIRWNDLGNILKAPKVLKEADRLNKDIKKALKSYATVQKNINQGFKDIDKSYKEAQALVNADINSVSNRMNLPKLDQKSIARMLFGSEILGKVKQAKKYQTMAQKYMPPKKEKVKKVKVKRRNGRNYKFGRPNSYPAFWLKLAKINSKTEQGTINGQIENITNDQVATGKLTRAEVKADFPSLQMRDIEIVAVVDHRDDAKMTVNGRVGNFLVTDKALSKSADAKFIIKKSNARTIFSGVLTPKTANIKINNSFRNIQFETSAKNQAVGEVLADVAKRNKVLTLDANIKGKWDTLKFEIKSNLAAAIQSSVRSLIQAKINKVRAKIKADIEKQISQSRGEVNGKINKMKADVTSKLAKGKAAIAKFQAQLNAQKKQATKKAKKSFKNPLKKLKIKGLSF